MMMMLMDLLYSCRYLRHISEHKVIEAIDPQKDADGFHPVNLGRMMIGLPGYLPATPYGIVELIKKIQD